MTYRPDPGTPLRIVTVTFNGRPEVEAGNRQPQYTAGHLDSAPTDARGAPARPGRPTAHPAGVRPIRVRATQSAHRRSRTTGHTGGRWVAAPQSPERSPFHSADNLHYVKWMSAYCIR